MKLINNTLLKTSLVILLSFLSGNLVAAEIPAVPWRNLSAATDIKMFYVLTGLALFQFILILVLASVLKSISLNRELWFKKPGFLSTAGIIVLFMLFSTSTFALSPEPPASGSVIVMNDSVFWILVAVNLFLGGILFSLLLIIRNMLKSLQPEKVEEVITVKKDIWAGAFNDAVPVEREAEIMTNHEYDGIRELDNNLPPWWIYGFYFTIVIAIAYLGYYHVTGQGDLPLEEYAKEMEEGKRQKEEYLAKAAAQVDENTVIAFTDGAKVGSGKETFMNFCQACHGHLGEGGVGPNMTDEYWLHGGGIQNIFKTIKYGVPAKGMISWEAQLTPVQIQEVASYILTLKGSNPANAKAAQGELWSAEPAEIKPDSILTDSIKKIAIVN